MLPNPKYAASLIAVVLLVFLLKFGLLSALYAGLLVHALVHAISPRFMLRNVGHRRAKLITVSLVASLVVSMLAVAFVFGLSFLKSGSGIPALTVKLADILDSTRATLPAWLSNLLPPDLESIKAALARWLREHSGELQAYGKEVGITATHIIVGMVVGGLVSLHESSGANQNVLAPLLAERARRLADAFRDTILAQTKISAINTTFTGIYLGVLLPAMGVKLPFVATLIGITFIVGLLPVLGNLISNTVIVTVSLSHSPATALASLVFLVAIHKLEYFLNAKIMGFRLQVKAWELLISMLAMEAAFGIAGLIAAPVYYAYVKKEAADLFPA